MQHPKVSVITPVYGRAHMIERLIDMYNGQDYPNIELIIFESGKSAPSHASMHHNISHICTTDKPSVGIARNKAIAWASGDIIVHMDSDDYYAPNWVTTSVNALLESEADLVGLKDAYFYKPKTDQLWFYTNRDPNRQHTILGATMCYYKRVWEQSKFKHTKCGEDTYFCDDIKGNIAIHDYHDGFMAMRHDNNTSKDVTRHPFFKQVGSSKAKEILGNSYGRFVSKEQTV